MKKVLAFVLGGGGARGALQVGAMRALLEAGIKPDMLVGTSIGAVNATYLALHGVSIQTLDSLVEAWHDAARSNLLPSNYLWLSVRALFNRPLEYPMHRMRNFFISHGIHPEMHFADIDRVRLINVAADLNKSSPLLYGLDPEDNILESLLASTALPPWVSPMRRQERMLIDGGAVSNLPIEPAIVAGATEIVALNLMDFRDVMVDIQNFGTFLGKLLSLVQRRQVDMELALAEARRVKVHHLHLESEAHVPMWCFDQTEELIRQGYQFAREQLTDGGLHALLEQPGWLERLKVRLGR